MNNNWYAQRTLTIIAILLTVIASAVLVGAITLANNMDVVAPACDNHSLSWNEWNRACQK